MSNNVSKEEYRKIINDICYENCHDEDPCDNKYCILKEVIFHSNYKVDLLYQMACLELFRKDLESARKYMGKDSKDIDTNYVVNKWIEDGYNVLFRKYFDKSISCKELYQRIIEDIESSESL
jgi:hypothetical protein